MVVAIITKAAKMFLSARTHGQKVIATIEELAEWRPIFWQLVHWGQHCIAFVYYNSIQLFWG